MSKQPRIILALDFPQKEPLLALIDKLDPSLCHLKIGFESFLRYGPPIIEEIASKGFKIFLDLKFHDIPNTVSAACAAAADMGVWLVNVHASGGPRMIAAASETLAKKTNAPKLLAVTVLTSMTEDDLIKTGVANRTDAQVFKLATMAQQAGADGVVCSPGETQELRGACGNKFMLVTPGIRPEGAEQDDQRRTMTPLDAIQAGSDYLVIGRPITKAANPVDVLNRINVTLPSL